jgi:hypothetical protein
MSDPNIPEDLAQPLHELIPRWRAHARELRDEGQSKIDAAIRLDAMADSAEALMGTGARPRDANGSGHDAQRALPRSKPVGLNAIRAVLKEDPDRVWSAGDLHQLLESRGWVTGAARNALHGTRTGLYRLWQNGEVEKMDTGRYRLAREANDPTLI